MSRHPDFEQKLDKEIAFHVEQLTRTYIEQGVAPAEAHQKALQEFGAVELAKDEVRDTWPLRAWLRDLRFGFRMMRNRPGFSLTVILTLALGIGASSTIFSLIDAVIIRPLSYPDSGRLVSLREAKSHEDTSQTPVAPGRLEDWNSLSSSFDGIAGSNEDNLIDTAAPVPERVRSAAVSPRFFSVLGMAPSLGRTFTPDEEKFGGPRAVVLSDGFWRRRFSADPHIVGQNFVLSGRNFTIAGVMPPQFQYPKPRVEVWAPQQAPPALLRIREARFYTGVARLKRGVTIDQARADLASVQRRLGEQYPITDAGWVAAVEPLKDSVIGKARRALWLLMGSVSLLLLIACANVACLLLAQLNSRSVEIALRVSLGAGRGAIARQLLSEGLVYSAGGGLLGLLIAFAGVDLIRKQAVEIPRITELAIDARMLAAACGVSIVSAILFSLAPILQTFRSNLRRVSIPVPRLLVAAQLALATCLLICAGLFLKSLLKLQETPLGFKTNNILTLHVGSSFQERFEATIQRHQRTIDALFAVPGVKSVAMSTGIPGSSPTWPREFEIAGERSEDGALRFASWRIVTSGYFQTLGIPIVAGRTCRMEPGTQHPFEAVVNQSFVKRYFHGRNPLGRALGKGPGGDGKTEIVGVVPDVREDGPTLDPQPLIYDCGYLRFWPDSEYLIQSSNAAAIAKPVREALRQLDPSRPVHSVRLLSEAHFEALAQTRFRSLLITLFSALALMLAAIGLYGLMAYMVAQRTREIGIRIAIGARPARILGDVLRSGATLAVCGTVAGIALAAALARLAGMPPSDVITYLSASALLLVVALVACLIPARRAMMIDPTLALRR